MSEKVHILKELLEYHFYSLEEMLENLEAKEMHYKPTEESNNIDWIVNHLTRICNTTFPKIIKGDPKFKPAGWVDDYKDHSYGLDKYKSDLAAGKKIIFEGLDNLTDAQLEEEIPFLGGVRVEGLFAYIGEIISHKGQIAYLRGTVKRLKAKNSAFLA